METLRKITSRLLKIEKMFNRMEKTGEIEIEDLLDAEQTINKSFTLLDDREEFLLAQDIKSEKTKSELVDTANCMSLCDKVWNQLNVLIKRKQNEGEPEIYEKYERDVWEMMYPNDDIDSNDFEVGEYGED